MYCIPVTRVLAIKYTREDAKPGDYSTLEPIVSTEPKADETPEQQLVRWAVNHELITEDMNLVKFLNEAGWTTIDQIEKEFSVHDIPADFPKRFHTRLMNAVRALRNEEPIVVEKKDSDAVQVVIITRVHVPQYYQSRYIDVDIDDIYNLVNPLHPYLKIRRW